MTAKTAASGASLEGWRGPALLATAGAAAAFAAAIVAQYGFGMTPCELCLWQRWPYAVGVPAAALGLALGASRGASAALLAFAAAAFVVGVGLAAFHSGVEWKWWAGLPSCSGAIAADTSLEAFLERTAANPPARCDQRAPFAFGLTMANWNGLVCLGAAAALALATRRRLAVA